MSSQTQESYPARQSSEALHSRLSTQPIISSHSHHLPDGEQSGLTLARILQNAYTARKWLGIPSPADATEVDAWLEKVGNRSFFIWLERAMQRLYGIAERLNAKTWPAYDAQVRAAHQDPQWHLRVLQDICHYERIANDCPWDPGSDLGHPDLFHPVFRINSFLAGYDKNGVDSNGNNAQLLYQARIDDIDEYIALLRQQIVDKKRAGCTALKSAIAYFRPIHIAPATREQAQVALRYAGTRGTEQDIRQFQDYVFEQICTLSAELDIPMQIHTGLGKMNQTNAMQVQGLVARHPDTTFILMHGSYPWTDDFAGLAFSYRNVIADLCWLPMISPMAAERALHELIEVCDADRIVWGCDTWTSEESLGARMAFEHVLSRVLSQKIADGWLSEDMAVRYARGILHDNADRVFKITRQAAR